MDWKQVAERIHQNAVKHGWWEEERPEYEILALIHSEWSEALEEYRHGRDMVWYGEGGKPEGIAVELVDGVIRVLDWMGKVGMQYEPLKEGWMPNVEEAQVPELVSELHFLTAMALDSSGSAMIRFYLCAIIQTVNEWIDRNGVDFAEVLEIKMVYNEKRPYRHGGLVC